MKTLQFAIAVVLLPAFLSSVALAQELMDGQVTRIDASANKITLKHGPLKKFEMDEPMTMVFRVQDAAMLKAVKVGDKIKFDAEKINGQFTVTKIEIASKEPAPATADPAKRKP